MYKKIIICSNYLIVILLLMSLFIYNKKFLFYIRLIIPQLKMQYEYEKNEHFLHLCNNQKKISIFTKKTNPKISIISPIHNSEKFILRFLNNIQRQNFINIEIILVDDYSLDNSVKLIEEYKKKDQRILLIKNKKNKGTFANRNLGFLFSKGEYIILPDPDDIISKNILKECFLYAKKYNYEVIRFNMYIGKKIINYKLLLNELENKPVYQPQLSTFIFYGNNKLNIIDYNLCNKFIKKEVYSKVLNKLKKYYLNLYITYSEDLLFNYFLFRTANSFYFLRKIGYYYIKNNLSITNNLFRKSKLTVKFCFILIQLFFQYSKNSNFEKDMINFLFTNFKQILNINDNFETIFNKDFMFYYETIKMLFKSKYITEDNKYFLLKFKKIIEIIKSKKNIFKASTFQLT